MEKIKIMLFVILALFMINLASAKDLFSNQTLDVKESGNIHITEIRDVIYPEGLMMSQDISFSRDDNITHLEAYDAVNNKRLGVTKIESTNKKQEYLIDFESPIPQNTQYKLRIEYDVNGKVWVNSRGINYFAWSWGGTNYSIPISYSVILPQYCIIKDSETYSKVIVENNQLTLKINGNTSGVVDSENNYFSTGTIAYWKINSSVETRIELSNEELYQGDHFQVVIYIKNSAREKIENVSVSDLKIPASLGYDQTQINSLNKINGEDEKCIQIPFDALSSEENAGIEVEITYYDYFGREQLVSVKKSNISVKKHLKTTGIFGIPLEYEGNIFEFIFRWFLTGYFVLLWVFNVRRKDWAGWNKISGMDKALFSVILSALNLFVAIAVIIAVLLPLMIINIFSDVSPYELPLLLLTIPVTAIIVDRFLDNFEEIKNRYSIEKKTKRYWEWIPWYYIIMILLFFIRLLVAVFFKI